jgi:hypothetical protein
MRIYVDSRSLRLLETEPLVAGSVGEYLAEFSFSEAWAGYSRTAVFKSKNGVAKEVVLYEGEIEIPWEVLEEPGHIQIGVYGIESGRNRPTLWSEMIPVYTGTEQADPSTPHDTTPWQDAVEFMGEAVERAEAAAKRAEEAGGGGGVDFTTDETLTLENGVLSVNRATDAEPDNTLPITSAAVYAEIGNINALLESI